MNGAESFRLLEKAQWKSHREYRPRLSGDNLLCHVITARFRRGGAYLSKAPNTPPPRFIIGGRRRQWLWLFRYWARRKERETEI